MHLVKKPNGASPTMYETTAWYVGLRGDRKLKLKKSKNAN